MHALPACRNLRHLHAASCLGAQDYLGGCMRGPCTLQPSLSLCSPVPHPAALQAGQTPAGLQPRPGPRQEGRPPPAAGGQAARGGGGRGGRQAGRRAGQEAGCQRGAGRGGAPGPGGGGAPPAGAAGAHQATTRGGAYAVGGGRLGAGALMHPRVRLPARLLATPSTPWTCPPAPPCSKARRPSRSPGSAPCASTQTAAARCLSAPAARTRSTLSARACTQR